MWNGQIWMKNSIKNIHISISQFGLFFFVKGDDSLDIFNYSISHLQPTCP